MNNTKVLLLLVVFVVFVNYLNYFMPDREKLHQRTELLRYKIEKEKHLDTQKPNDAKLQLPIKELFYDGKRLNYSQAMGDFQERITKAAKGMCRIIRTKWAQVPSSTKWYDTLKIDTVVECTPKNMFLFINKLREDSKIYNIKNIMVVKSRREPKLQLHMQLVTYRMHDEK